MSFFTDNGWDYVVWVWTSGILLQSLSELGESDYVEWQRAILLSRRA